MKIREYVKLSLPFAIASCHDAIWKELSSRLRQESCGFLEALILIALFVEEHGGSPSGAEVTPSGLAEVLGTSRGNVSHALSRLERRRLIRRALGPRDARSYRLALGPEGRGIACRLIRVLDEIEATFENQLGGEGVRSVIGDLDRIKRISVACNIGSRG